MLGLTNNKTFFIANHKQRKNIIKSMSYLIAMLNDEKYASTFDYYFCYDDEEQDDFESLENSMTAKYFDTLVDEFVNAMTKANR